MRRVTPSLFFACVAALSGCASQAKQSPFTGLYKDYATCRAEYAALDARIDAAGVRNAAYYRVPGFPYLRTDRMLASFRDEAHGLEGVSEWTRRMRDLDQEARDYENANLGLTDFEVATLRSRFLNCGSVLARIELSDPATFKRLVKAIPSQHPQSDRRGLTSAKLKASVIESSKAGLADYSQALGDPAQGETLRLWTAKPVEDIALLVNGDPSMQYNALGIPGLFGSQWRTLAEYNAPQLWIETAGETDLPATPQIDAKGPTADTSRPALNYQIDFTRFGGRTLVQISYFGWFKSAGDATTGPIDGFIWRVTLDTKLQPLIYDSLHASGRNHRWYPVRPLTPRPDTALTEFIAPEPAPPHSATLRLRAGTHDIRSVVSASEVSAAEPQQYELRPYEELYSLPRPEGGTRSLFGPDGLVAGSNRPDALRQYGHHVMASLGRTDFDDPFLLDASFVAPEWPAPEKPPSARTQASPPRLPEVLLTSSSRP